MTLIEASNRLNNPRITSIARNLREQRSSIRRAAFVALYTWLIYWVSTSGQSTGLQGEANHVLPWISSFLAVSIGWAAMLRFPAFRDKYWCDVVGSVANIVAVAVLLHVGWNISLPLVAILPLGCITIGALHGRRAFFLSLVFTTLVVATSPPAGYWASRPFVGMLALALLVGLPLTVTRVMLALREVSLEAIRARDAQSRFLATMSHELRTPLNSVVNATELLQVGDHSEASWRLINLLAVNSVVLRNRVNEVLDVHSIDAGRLFLSNEPFTFARVLKVVEDVIRPLATPKGIDLSFSDEAADRLFKSDPARIEQMLTNLCTNAVKFTPKGGRVKLTIKVKPDAGDLHLVTATVEDTGIGVPDSLKPLIFEPFFQASSGVSRQHEGVGLGLLIVRNLAGLLNGSVSVADNPTGPGALFILRLRIQAASPGDSLSETKSLRESVAEHRARVRSLHCLIVDDNESNREIASRIIELAGHTFQTAQTAPEAIELFESNNFDLMLLDLHMPEISGWTLLDRYHAKRALGVKVPPIIVVSADANPEAMIVATQKGSSHYLLKPIPFLKLLEILEHTASAGLYPAPKHSNAPNAPGSWIEFLREEGDPQELAAFIEICVAGIRSHLLGLESALTCEDSERMRFHAHSLCNEFLNLGDAKAASVCADFANQHALGLGSTALADIRRHAIAPEAEARSLTPSLDPS
jgi:two-component system, sensor histidine kinase RpfC